MVFFPVYTVKEYSEAVMRKTDSTMAKRKRTEGHERQTLQWPKEKGQKDTKDRLYNGQKKKDRRTNNDQQNSTQKTKDRATRPPSREKQ
jgi:hypothetical protein